MESKAKEPNRLRLVSLDDCSFMSLNEILGEKILFFSLRNVPDDVCYWIVGNLSNMHFLRREETSFKLLSISPLEVVSNAFSISDVVYFFEQFARSKTMTDKGLEEPLEDTRTSVKNLVADDDKEEGAQLTPAQRKKEKRKITKNVYVISLGFLFLFTAFQSLQNLQSSLNKVEGLGLASLSVIYGALILSCIFVPPFVIGRLGCKWTLVLSMTGYVLYTVANYYARWGTLIPASIIIGEYMKKTLFLDKTVNSLPFFSYFFLIVEPSEKNQSEIDS